MLNPGGVFMNFVINYADTSGVPHRHTNYEIIVYTRGEGQFICDYFHKDIAVGDMIVIPPNTTHHNIVGPDARRIYINGDFGQFFNLDTIHILSDNAQGDGVALAEMIYHNRYVNFEYVCALINALTHFILNNIVIDSPIHSTVKEIVEKISNDFCNHTLSLSAVLRETGYSEDYIRSQFRRITGKTPTEFLTTVRITHACYLIDTYKKAIPLTDISEQCSYTDYVYFSKQFKRITGVSPRKYTEKLI